MVIAQEEIEAVFKKLDLETEEDRQKYLQIPLEDEEEIDASRLGLATSS